MSRLFISTLVVLSLLASCITIQPGYPSPSGDGGDHEDTRSNDERIYPFSALGIPKGHLPPPGECKIWIPGREAGQQGPPQSCSSAFREAPLGAWVITHAANRYKVNVCSKTKPGVIVEVRFYALQ
ncbi:hypothetical protein [Longitalea luteola]|uniref:hypothetical protein n=1 Tax=Longitalea luteola TaxID=2812563 RepID=UPI001A974FD8|nr:hypothetical protein [Longitalea luteola]